MKHIITIVILSLQMHVAFSQKMNIGFLFPAGGQIGSTFTIEVGGLNIKDASGVYFSHKGIQGKILSPKSISHNKQKRGKLNDQSAPQLADRVFIEVTIDKNTPIGIHNLRFISSQGVSNQLPFDVSPYTTYIETSESTKENPDRIVNLPVVATGQMTPGGIDYFSFQLEQGADIVIATKGRALIPYIADAVPGWFQPKIRLTNSRGKEVAFSDDYRHSVDPLIIYRVEKSNIYTLSIQDAIYRGREDFNYRIQIGKLPWIESVHPAVVINNKRTQIEVHGVNLGETCKHIKLEHSGVNQISFAGKNGFPSNSLPIYSSWEDKENRFIGYDSIVSPFEKKYFNVQLIANKKVHIDLLASRINSMIDASMRLIDSNGNIVATNDDYEDTSEGLSTHHADPQIFYTPEATADYVIEITSLQPTYDFDNHFCIMLRNRIPDYKAYVSPANISIPKGGTALMHIDIQRENKSKHPIYLDIIGLPQGSKTSNLGPIRKNSWDISITAPNNSKEGTFPIQIRAYIKRQRKPSTMNRLSHNTNKKIRLKSANPLADTQQVIATDRMMQAFYYEHLIPAPGLSINITKIPAFSISLLDENSNHKSDEIYYNVGDSIIPIRISIKNHLLLNDSITLTLGRKSKYLELKPITIAASTKDILLPIKIIGNLPTTKNMVIPQYVTATVKGEVIKQKKQTIQTAKYKEISPIFFIKNR